MASMTWKDEYSVGNELLDSQHRRLIALVDALSGDADLGQVLDDLGQYCEAHFRSEEELLEDANYPDLDKHRSYHNAFRTWLNETAAAQKAGGEYAPARADVQSYLRVWLANHLLVYDKAFEPWLK